MALEVAGFFTIHRRDRRQSRKQPLNTREKRHKILFDFPAESALIAAIGQALLVTEQQNEIRNTQSKSVMAKTLFQSELVTRGPAKVKILSEVRASKYSKPGAPKPPYVTLELDGAERTYNCENASIEAWFAEQTVGSTITICAEGSREEATITLVGHEIQQPAPRQPAATRQPGKAAAPSAPAEQPAAAGTGMRAGEIRYERTVGLPNYCSEKIGITVFLEEGAKASDALAYAKKFVESHLQTPAAR